MAEFVASVPVRHCLGKVLQVRCGFPFLPINGIAANNKEVRRVPDAQLPTVLGLVSKFGRRRLIIELQNFSVVFVFVQRRQFDPVALSLDGDPHLSARVADAYVSRGAAYSTRGRGRTDGCNDRSGLGR
jgi:hypothetical protein